MNIEIQTNIKSSLDNITILSKTIFLLTNYTRKMKKMLKRRQRAEMKNYVEKNIYYQRINREIAVKLIGLGEEKKFGSLNSFEQPHKT